MEAFHRVELDFDLGYCKSAADIKVIKKKKYTISEREPVMRLGSRSTEKKK